HTILMRRKVFSAIANRSSLVIGLKTAIIKHPNAHRLTLLRFIQIIPPPFLVQEGRGIRNILLRGLLSLMFCSKVFSSLDKCIFVNFFYLLLPPFPCLILPNMAWIFFIERLKTFPEFLMRIIDLLYSISLLIRLVFFIRSCFRCPERRVPEIRDTGVSVLGTPGFKDSIFDA